MAKEKTDGFPLIKIGTSLTWPFSLEQYQNGKVSAWAETEVPNGMEKEGYEAMNKIVQAEVERQIQEINDLKNKG